MLRHPDTNVPEQDILTQLSHRGPDDQGRYGDTSVRLLHTRLSIMDVAGGHQPIISADGQYILVANGELYNDLELRAELTARGHRFRTRCDSETILQAYIAFGLACLPRLQGMYAFALYDRAAGRLHLARDRLGIKPLYFGHTSMGLAFASEIKALALFDRRAARIGRVELEHFFQWGSCFGTTSIDPDFEAVQPGEVVSIDCSRAHHFVTRQTYWSAKEVVPQRMDFDQAAEAFDVLFPRVLGQHLRSDVPWGLYLSGGVDSSILLAAMQSLISERVHTYSLAFSDTDNTLEGEMAESLARRFNTRHTRCTVAAADLRGSIAHTVWAGDDLFVDTANLPVAYLARQARGTVKTVLTGEGGDEVFAGYGRYRQYFPQYAYKRIFKSETGGYRNAPIFTRRALRSLIADDGMATHGAQARYRPWAGMPRAWSRLAGIQCAELADDVPNGLLPKVDRMLMGWGLEGRVPYLDHRLVEFGLSLPDALKVRGRQGKVFLKRWGERYLSPELLWRKKRGFSVPMAQVLDEDFVTALARLLPRTRGVRAYLNPGAVQALLERQLREHDVSSQVWSILVFALWVQIFQEHGGRYPGHDIDPIAVLES